MKYTCQVDVGDSLCREKGDEIQSPFLAQLVVMGMWSPRKNSEEDQEDTAALLATGHTLGILCGLFKLLNAFTSILNSAET